MTEQTEKELVFCKQSLGMSEKEYNDCYAALTAHHVALTTIRRELISLKVDIKSPLCKVNVDGRLDEILKVVRRAMKQCRG